MLNNYTIRSAENDDAKQALALLPALADFDVPQYRNPDHLWQGDAKLFEQYLAGDTPDTHALVAIDNNANVHGIAIYTLKKELLSSEPSAHLEVLAVDATCRRLGIGRALIDATEAKAKKQGATSLTLHVFANNLRARGLYQSVGFKEELLRCYKPI